MYFGSAGCFFVWAHEKHGSMYEKYKESNLVGYRVGNVMIYTYIPLYLMIVSPSFDNTLYSKKFAGILITSQFCFLPFSQLLIQ